MLSAALLMRSLINLFHVLLRWQLLRYKLFSELNPFKYKKGENWSLWSNEAFRLQKWEKYCRNMNINDNAKWYRVVWKVNIFAPCLSRSSVFFLWLWKEWNHFGISRKVYSGEIDWRVAWTNFLMAAHGKMRSWTMRNQLFLSVR